MKLFRWIAIVLVVFLVMGVVGAAAYKVYAQGQGGITLEEATAIALGQHPGAKVLATETENEGGIQSYEIELDNRAEVEVDASAGSILPPEPENSPADDRDDVGENDDDAGESTAVNGQSQPDEIVPTKVGITAEEAKRIAEEANPGATAQQVDFENEGGVDMWEVELSNNLEVELDANTGAILSTERD